MTDHRELLELAARAMGGNLESFSDGSFTLDVPRATRKELGQRVFMRPDKSSGDCFDMCAALGIDTKWGASIVACGSDRVLRWLAEPCASPEYRSAAWRLAALRVAAEIGKGMRG